MGPFEMGFVGETLSVHVGVLGWDIDESTIVFGEVLIVPLGIYIPLLIVTVPITLWREVQYLVVTCMPRCI